MRWRPLTDGRLAVVGSLLVSPSAVLFVEAVHDSLLERCQLVLIGAESHHVRGEVVLFHPTIVPTPPGSLSHPGCYDVVYYLDQQDRSSE